MEHIAIVGAGFAGLVAAQALSGDFLVSIFDKSRGVAGRMSTRYADPFQFDHGAQYVTADSVEFRAFVRHLAHVGVAEPWSGQFGVIEKAVFRPESTAQRRWVGSPKMNAIAKHLSMGLNTQLGGRIEKIDIDEDGKLLLWDQQGNQHGPYDRLISAIPHPQFVALLQNSNLEVDEALQQVQMTGCYSLMLGGESLSLPTFDGAHVLDSPIEWIAVNSRKPGRRTAPSLLMHSSSAWAEKYMDTDQVAVKEMLMTATADLLGPTVLNAEHAALHRWRYGRVQRAFGRDFWASNILPLNAIGDWCLGDTVEHAFLSARALSTSLLAEKA